MSDEARPFPKSSQLARGERRRARKVATSQEWQTILSEKIGPCRVCVMPWTNGGAIARLPYPVEFHHLLSRARGGDDVADNIIPLCRYCHGKVTAEDPDALALVARTLTDAEYAYLIGKLGEGALERLYGVGR